MPRPRKDEVPDVTRPVNLTVGAIDRLICPPGKAQAFLRDVDGNGLRVRVTPAGTKSFVFEQSLRNQSIRWTIGSTDTWSIDRARQEAKRLSTLIDNGLDPREVEREEARQREEERDRREAEAATAAAREAADAITVRTAWDEYIAERRQFWGARHILDHERLAQPGGKPRRRASGKVTQAGPLAPLMDMRLIDLTIPVVEDWARAEAKIRPARARLSLRLLKAFLRWAADEPHLRGRADPLAASAKKAKDVLGKPARKTDLLQREQLRPWFRSVRAIGNPVIAAYLQVLLLTGRRREQVMALRWEDVSFEWKTIRMNDKTEGETTVPLTPYMAHLMAGLPRRNDWVFSSVKAIKSDPKSKARRARYHAEKGSEAPTGDMAVLSASGRLNDPSDAHRGACSAAGIDGLTLHGLRRSFATLSEWVEVPAGVAAQIQGHAPAGVREQNYIRRPIDMLRLWHEKIEAWMLDAGGVAFEAHPELGEPLRRVR